MNIDFLAGYGFALLVVGLAHCWNRSRYRRHCRERLAFLKSADHLAYRDRTGR